MSLLATAQKTVSDHWMGHCKGTLNIYNNDSIRHKVQMDLELKSLVKDSIFQWKITYTMNDKQDIRDYEIHLLDRAKGYYQMDEKSSIFLDGFLNDNMVTFFLMF